MFSYFEPFLSHTGHHLLIHGFDKMCCNFEYDMIGPEASRCVVFESYVVTVLHLNKNEELNIRDMFPMVRTTDITASIA